VEGKSLAPQVGLEPTTLRLTATQVHQKRAASFFTKTLHTLRYVANGRDFSYRLARGALRPDLITAAIYSARHHKEFEGASPQKSPQGLERGQRVMF
jgi:hypothetical protein